jgi:hypothetical protein
MKESFFVTGSRLECRISRKGILIPAQRLQPIRKPGPLSNGGDGDDVRGHPADYQLRPLYSYQYCIKLKCCIDNNIFMMLLSNYSSAFSMHCIAHHRVCGQCMQKAEVKLDNKIIKTFLSTQTCIPPPPSSSTPPFPGVIGGGGGGDLNLNLPPKGEFEVP